ncbi:MarR family winged helix-turn-helix transcriptional regulator [Nocardia sputorum]|uniref:MarR family winged helix-turn-helix transcriptional regulator n=1 Tax=Nocardia sputorum TaxID=2984338 RepID=UPI002492CCA2|nr:MarR family winged helix-turn-helix transcriptional regulator [Nocardia sputorum]
MPTTTDRARVEYLSRLAAQRPDIALCRVSSAIARAAEAHAQQQGLGVGQHLVLKMLADIGPCSQRVLSEELRIDRSVMVGIADDLEGSGYVRRERDPADRRAYAVTITEKGNRALSNAEQAVPEFLDRAFTALEPDERRQLTALLGKLLTVS